MRGNSTDRELKIKAIRHAREIQKRNCEKSYYVFFKRAWQEIEFSIPYEDNWHVEYICGELQLETERLAAGLPKTKDIIINIPPRSLKSLIVSVMWCPWAWTRYPHLRFINSSYALNLSIDHLLKGRQLIKTEWYQTHWGHVYKLRGDQDAKGHYQNDKGGTRYAGSVSGGVLGHGADVIVADDILDPRQAKSEVERKTSNEHFTKTLHTRLNDQRTGVKVIVMQRLHEDDVTGHVLSENPDEFKHICIPAEEAEGKVSPEELSGKYQNGLFFPSRFSKEVLAKNKKSLRVDYAGQMNQRPTARQGNIFQRDWFRYYDVGPSDNPDHHPLPTSFDKVIQSWDMTFKSLSQSKSKSGNIDFVVCQIWGKKGACYYLLWQFREQVGFVGTLKEFIRITKAWPQATRKLIEDKANGPAIQDILKKKISGIIAVPVRGAKPERAEAVSYLYEAGNVYYPRPSRFSWVDGCINEHCDFPNVTHDDQVDAGSQALDDLSEGGDNLDDLDTFLRM